MGQAFDRDGNVLGEAYGETKREVFDKLSAQFKDAHEIRIKSLGQEDADLQRRHNQEASNQVEAVAMQAVGADAEAAEELPRYQCHKVVRAGQIRDIHYDPFGGSPTIFFVEAFGPIRVSAGWCQKHEPVVGGYYVVYEDGYASFSPAAAFESGYTRIDG